MKFLNSEVKNCPYCTAFKVADKSAFQLPWNKILYETDNFIVMPSLGAIVEGWLLIISKEHCISMGALSESFDRELTELVQDVSSIIKHAYQITPTIFEHGACIPHSKVGCGIDHAHLHIVPLNFSLLAESKRRNIKVSKVTHSIGEDFVAMRHLYSSSLAYLFIREPCGQGIFLNVQESPSQFFRKIIAEQNGVAEKYNYREHYFEQNVIATVEKINSCLNQTLFVYSK